MPKIHDLFNEDKTHVLHCFVCPGCGNVHGFDSRWTFNEDYEKPTFSPSLLINKSHPSNRCHSFVKEGKIQFLNDCHHKLAGQTVEIPDWDED